MRACAGAGCERMPVTRRGATSTPEEAPTRASAPDEACTSHCQTHPPSMHTGVSHSHAAAKRKVITPPSARKGSVMSPTKTFKRKQQAVSQDAETAASSKRHKGNPAADQKCRDSPKENTADLATGTGSIGPCQPLKHDFRGPSFVQSPSRPPLLPRTPATADRTGRIPGMHSNSDSVL